MNIPLPKPSIGCNKDFVAECNAILANYKSGKLTKAQFLEACDYLDEAARAYEKARLEMDKRLAGELPPLPVKRPRLNDW